MDLRCDFMKKQIIRKWYDRLAFPQMYDADFCALLSRYDAAALTCVEAYDDQKHLPEENLLAYLFFCEALAQRYAVCGIPETVLTDTLHDIVLWTDVYYSITGSLGLAETQWLRRHLQFRLFKLGRLQFCMERSQHAIGEAGVQKGDLVVEVHIPAGEALCMDQCRESLMYADRFFSRYFCDHRYTCYTCHSWLLDTGLQPLLKANSNIAQFQNLFRIVDREESDAVLKYVFRWDTTRDNLLQQIPRSSFAEQIKAAIQAGMVFYEALGYRAREATWGV